MTTSYVLINCELGSEDAIIRKLKSIDKVKKVQGTVGAYDVLIKIESDHDEKIKDIIANKIRKIEKIRSTLTLTCVEDHE